MNKLQTQLEKAQERDELEATNREVLQLSAQLRSFELQRLNAYRQKRVLSWLDRRRDDFEEQCLTYQQLLANAQIKADLRIPFDRERPNESQGLLLTQVEHHLDD